MENSSTSDNRRVVRVGKRKIGGENPVSVQTMTNTDTKDIESTTKQIKQMVSAGAEIVRLSLYDLECVDAFRLIRERFPGIPFVGDIHYDHRIAIEAVQKGIDKIRLNPGNIESESKIRDVVSACRERGIPIRVGANSGSINKRFKSLEASDALVESALEQVRILEKNGFEDIVIAVKSSDVRQTIRAYQSIYAKVLYPLHLGVTEAGPLESSLIKSSVAMGLLLINGIGDTIRYSITGDPVQEVNAGIELLIAIGEREGVQIVSCPTCARTTIDMNDYVERVRSITSGIRVPLKIAIMGCVVNGVGEGENADIGIAGTKNGGAVFIDGRIMGRYSKDELFPRFEAFLLKKIQQKKEERA